jgi:hypothetical protein
MTANLRIRWPTFMTLMIGIACTTLVFAQTGSPGAGERTAPGMGSGAMPMQPGAGGMGPGMGMGRRMGMNMPGFSDFDADNDGRISQSELNAVRSERRRERAEQGYPMRGAANAPSFSSIDADGSGGISRDEFSRFHGAVGRPQAGGR